MKIPRGAVPRDSIQEKVRPKRPLRAARDVCSIVSGVGLVPGTVTHPPAASSYPSTTAPSGRMEGPSHGNVIQAHAARGQYGDAAPGDGCDEDEYHAEGRSDEEGVFRQRGLEIVPVVAQGQGGL